MANYLFLITLKGTNPEINRLLSIPKNMSFHDLHRVIQTSFGWADCHLYQFLVTEHSDRPVSFFHSRQEYLILEREPSPEGPSIAAASSKLFKVFEDDRYEGKALEYQYDFGDNWVHSVELVGWSKGGTDGRVVCFAGQGHSPAEDAGGVEGWQEIVNAYKAKKPNNEQKELREWYETTCSNSDPRGLSNVGGAWEWSREKVNQDLRQLRFGTVEF